MKPLTYIAAHDLGSLVILMVNFQNHRGHTLQFPDRTLGQTVAIQINPGTCFAICFEGHHQFLRILFGSF